MKIPICIIIIEDKRVFGAIVHEKKKSLSNKVSGTIIIFSELLEKKNSSSLSYCYPYN